MLGIGEGGFQTANTGSATAVLIWKNITANRGNELRLRIFQIFTEGSFLSVKQLSPLIRVINSSQCISVCTANDQFPQNRIKSVKES